MITYTVEKGLKSQDEAEAYFSLGHYIIQALIGALMMGLITSTVVALFTKRRK